MFRDVVTVFNFHEPSGLWYTTVFRNCDLLEAKSAKNTSDSGTVNGDAVTLLVNVEHQGGEKISYRDQYTSEVMRYIGPKAYSRLDDPAGFFTFCPEVDFLAAGDFSSSAPIPDDAYDEGLYHVMNREQDVVYMITSAAFYGLIPHFEIGGR